MSNIVSLLVLKDTVFEISMNKKPVKRFNT